MEKPRLHAGTQVVLKNNLINGQREVVHPAGAVAMVVRTPTTEGELFHVQFPDGVLARVAPESLKILKNLKNEGTGASSAFDLDGALLFKSVVGSRAYGLETEESDTDFRGVYIASQEMVWSLHDPPEQFEDHEAQSVFWELRKFLLLALKANPNILETLHSPEMEILDEIGEELVSMRSVFLSKLIFQTFSGYAMSQFKKMEQDLRNHGEVRWKHAMHLLRLLISGRQTLETGLLNISMVEHREFLLSVKRGELKWEEVADRRKELHREFEQAFAKSELPERPDSSRVNAFLVSARKRAFMRMRKIME